jgi:hypothetical protein
MRGVLLERTEIGIQLSIRNFLPYLEEVEAGHFMETMLA